MVIQFWLQVAINFVSSAPLWLRLIQGNGPGWLGQTVRPRRNNKYLKRAECPQMMQSASKISSFPESFNFRRHEDFYSLFCSCRFHCTRSCTKWPSNYNSIFSVLNRRDPSLTMIPALLWWIKRSLWLRHRIRKLHVLLASQYPTSPTFPTS